MEGKQNLPAGWRWVRLGEVCEFLDYLRIPVNDTERQKRVMGKKKSELYPYYGANGQVGWIDDYLFDEELVLLAEDGGFFGSTEKPVAYRVSGKCWVNNHAHVLRAKRDIVEEGWLYFALAIRPDILKFVSGTTRPKLNQEQASLIPLPLPPLKEQQRIAGKLQELMREVERARLACEKQLEAANALPSAYLREVFESPEAHNWPKKRLGEVCKIITGSTPRTDDDSNWDGEILWATPSDMGKITGFTIEDTERKISEKGLKSCSTNLLPAGSILLTTRAPIGNIAVNLKPMCTNQGFKSFIPSSQIHNWFLFFTLKYSIPALQSMGRGQTFTEISKAQVGNFLIPLPPLSEQKRIAEYLKEKITQAEKLKATIEKELTTINSLPQSILSKTFKGEL